MKNEKQKQPFANVLKNRYSEKFHNIHKKAPVLDSLFNKAAVLKAYNFIKKRPNAGAFL